MRKDAIGNRLRPPLVANAVPLVIDAQGAIEVDPDFHPGPGIGGTVPTGRNIDQGAFEADGVVVADHAPVLVAEDVVETPAAGPGNPGGDGILRGDREATVVPRQVASQHVIGLLPGARVGEPQFAAEAVLKGAPESLDAAF